MDYLLNQNQEEAKEWLKFLCKHTDGDGLNLYQYCQANPVGYEDPSGHNCGTTQSHYNSDEEQHPK